MDEQPRPRPAKTFESQFTVKARFEVPDDGDGTVDERMADTHNHLQELLEKAANAPGITSSNTTGHVREL